MLKRILGAAIAAGAAIGAAAIVKLIIDQETGEEEPEEAEEVRFISIEDKAEEEKPAEKAAETKEYPAEIEEIATLYPYLSKDFIAEQFGRNAAFNEQYPEDSLITITHKAKFGDTETMKEFTKIGEDNGYASEILNDTEATITRKMFTEDGSILSDIYNVSNQVACLKGTYEGYNIAR